MKNLFAVSAILLTFSTEHRMLAADRYPTVMRLRSVAPAPSSPCLALLIPPAQFVSSAICTSPDGQTYELAQASLTVGLQVSASQGAFANTVTVGNLGNGYATTIGASAIETRGALVFLVSTPSAERRMYPLRYLDAQRRRDAEGRIFIEGEGETASDGKAVIVFDTPFLEIANTDPAERGDYSVFPTSYSDDPVYADPREATPAQFVVRSSRRTATRFRYLLTVVKRGEESARLKPEAE